jgi:hypothetical protein
MKTVSQCVEAISKEMHELSKALASTIGTNGTPDYQAAWRLNKVEELRNNIDSKRIPIACVADWTKKDENYIRRKIPTRNQHVNTFYARDVVKFLCDEWGFDYPPELSEGAAA